MTAIITVEGMSCDHCEETVKAALRDVSGVVVASVDREAARASIEGNADVAALVRAVEDAE